MNKDRPYRNWLVDSPTANVLSSASPLVPDSSCHICSIAGGIDPDLSSSWLSSTMTNKICSAKVKIERLETDNKITKLGQALELAEAARQVFTSVVRQNYKLHCSLLPNRESKQHNLRFSVSPTSTEFPQDVQIPTDTEIDDDLLENADVKQLNKLYKKKEIGEAEIQKCRKRRRQLKNKGHSKWKRIKSVEKEEELDCKVLELQEDIDMGPSNALLEEYEATLYKGINILKIITDRHRNHLTNICGSDGYSSDIAM